jgi:hypothetical protein
VSDRKPFLLRIDPKVLEALERWATNDLRSLNGQIEFILRRALIDQGRMRKEPPPDRGPKKPGADRA